MKFKKIFIIFFLTSLISSCSNEQIKKSVIEEKHLELQVLEAYREGLKSLEAQDVDNVRQEGRRKMMKIR